MTRATIRGGWRPTAPAIEEALTLADLGSRLVAVVLDDEPDDLSSGETMEMFVGAVDLVIE